MSNVISYERFLAARNAKLEKASLESSEIFLDDYSDYDRRIEAEEFYRNQDNHSDFTYE